MASPDPPLISLEQSGSQLGGGVPHTMMPNDGASGELAEISLQFQLLKEAIARKYGEQDPLQTPPPMGAHPGAILRGNFFPVENTLQKGARNPMGGEGVPNWPKQAPQTPISASNAIENPEKDPESEGYTTGDNYD